MTQMTWAEYREKYPPFVGPKGPQHCRRFPGCCHHEENRQNTINLGNWNHRMGWLPCGDNWWKFPAKNIEHNHFNPMTDVTVIVKTPHGTKRLVSE